MKITVHVEKVKINICDLLQNVMGSSLGHAPQQHKNFMEIG